MLEMDLRTTDGGSQMIKGQVLLRNRLTTAMRPPSAILEELIENDTKAQKTAEYVQLNQKKVN